MAASRSRKASSARSSSSKAGKRSAQVEVLEESGGGVDAAIAIFTTILLIAGFLVLDYELGSHYGEGALFDSSYEAPQG